ncbi:MAG: glutamine synthetase [Acidobacteria bacterium]|nr:glutamine synthetase [Acidobacteriota bacterium]
MKTNELKGRVQRGEIETVIAAFTDHHGRLLGKRFTASYFLDQVAAQGTHACDYLLTTDMEMNPVPGYKFASWELGYGDFHLKPDLPTLTRVSWLDKTALVHCDVMREQTHERVAEAPRSILRAEVERARKAGFGVMAASELEYYAFRTSYRDAAKNGYTQLEPFGHYLEDYHLLQGARCEFYTAAVRKHLEQSGVPVENSKGEWGLGQHEVNVRYAEVMAMADRHMLFKQCLKEVADQMGVSVTFMAKPFEGQAGSSCHIHMSLWADDVSAFAGAGPEPTDLFQWFLGGWIRYAPDFMVFYAPTVNSYKRYEEMSWAPTRLAWSRDNRTAGFRVVGQGKSLRIECRIPGADANPYLAFAASLASGLAGIEQKIEPPEQFSGDVYAARHLPRVPYSLAEAAELFAGSGFVKQTLGEDVTAHYAHCYRNEARAFDRAVTDWERKRYFERI